MVTAAASGNDHGENAETMVRADELRECNIRATRTTSVPASNATLSMEKKSSKVSLFMINNSVETTSYSRLVIPLKRGQNGGVTTLKDRIKADITEAMKAREEAKLSTLRMVLSAIQNAEVAGDEAIVLTDDQAIKVLQSEAKKRAESAQIYADAGRTEAAAKERAELAVIEAYLPAAMSDDEVAAIVADEIAKAAAAGQTGGKAMGAVVKAVRDRVGSGADGGKIAALVKSALG